MSSTSGDGHDGGDNEDMEADESTRNTHGRAVEHSEDEDEDADHFSDAEEGFAYLQGAESVAEDGLVDGLEHSEEEVDTGEDYLQLNRADPGTSEDEEVDGGPSFATAESPESSQDDSSSIPDRTPSLQGSLPSTPGRISSPGPRKSVSRTASGALQPFERRFEARPPATRSPSSRTASPAFLSPHSRQLSLTSQRSQLSSQADSEGPETPQAPWDVIRWTKLRKITGQAFSDAGKRNFGRPTCLAVSALIAIGTSKGLVLGFDYHQTLKIIIGQGTKATECGSVTALAIAADYSTIAAGHANGHIFTWEINRPSQPFLRIPPLEPGALRQNNPPDGHIASCAILHVGFLGTRHTALVSADSSGMAFSHVATRGLGPVTRTIKTTRLLGRYPPLEPQVERTRKPSSVLAFSTLPLGNVEQPTDMMGLTALLTPYLLVIVSTTPMAQTQHKSARPKEISPHGTLSGCLAWFPAVKLKSSQSDASKGASDTKLVYCWSNVLTVLDVKVIDTGEPPEAGKPPSLEFHARNRWRAEEAIVAVQWLSRSVIGVLTISQRLLIVEDGSLQVTDSIDLMQRQMYHQDLFSEQLKSVVEQLNSADPSLHGVVADAFYMSYKVYKGRTFLLGYNDLTVGTLSNWADRLMALMEAGDHIAAIRLATDYYAGSANNVTVGLPDSDKARHAMVKERLLAMISASLDYTFSQHDASRETRLREIATVCFDACVNMHEIDYLFGKVFDMFEEVEEDQIFIWTLEPYVLDGDITIIPPEIVKSLVSHFISENQAARLEELLCRLDPHSFDLDQMTLLCEQHQLYDALVYIWSQGIGDFVTPLMKLISVVKMLQDDFGEDELADNPFYQSAVKVYTYLAYSLTSRRYPGGELMEDGDAFRAKADIYECLFSGKAMPEHQDNQGAARINNLAQHEPPFSYLVLLLLFDASSFMSMLNEAFEDPFLNATEEEELVVNGTSNEVFAARSGYKMTRQHIISIMLVVVKRDEFSAEQIIYLDMFIARSLPKYPGQLVLSGSLLNTFLRRLCKPPLDSLRDDCQLSVEYLLSAYRPSDVSILIEDLQQARFFRVLKSVYRNARMFGELLQTYFDDPDDKESVFDCIAHCLRPKTGLVEKQVQLVNHIIEAHFQDLVDINIVQTARTLAVHAFHLLRPCLEAVKSPHAQFIFLRSLLEPNLLRDATASQYGALRAEDQAAFTEQYVQLMCSDDPTHVADYVGGLPTGDLRLDEVLPAMERSQVVDAAVVLLARDGLAKDAMDRLIIHLQRLQQTMIELITAASHSPNPAGTQEASQDLLEQIEKYTKIGIWLCQGESVLAQREKRARANLSRDVEENDLDLHEYLWLNLVDAVVQLTKNASEAIQDFENHPTETSDDSLDSTRLSTSLRSNVQSTFTALLAATATPSISGTEETQARARSRDQMSFIRILRAFLTKAATTAPSIADLRVVLSDILSAYTFEQGVLSLANELLGSDVFAEIQDANEQWQRGWRPRTQVCEQCKRRAWGPGIGEIVWDEWVVREQDRASQKARKMSARAGGEVAQKLEKGKAKATEAAFEGMQGSHNQDARRLALVVFACRHVYHRVCLDEDYRDGKPPKQLRYQCPLCK